MLILSIPLDDPGEDKYTALMAHLRILGAPKHYCTLPHEHLVTALREMVRRNARPQAFANWLLAERMYLILDYDNQTFHIGKKDQTDD
jgi:hypothetical protein